MACDARRIRKLPKRPLSWTWFVALTFGRDVSAAQAGDVLVAYIREASRLLRVPFAYAGSLDYKQSGCGRPTIREHIHILLYCSKQDAQQEDFLKDLWQQPQFGGHRTKGTGADIRPYDATAAGSFYVIKHIDDPNWELLYQNLDLASRVQYLPPRGRARARRRQNRQLSRVQI